MHSLLWAGERGMAGSGASGSGGSPQRRAPALLHSASTGSGSGLQETQALPLSMQQALESLDPSQGTGAAATSAVSRQLTDARKVLQLWATRCLTAHHPDINLVHIHTQILIYAARASTKQ